MKLSNKELESIEVISAISGIDNATIRSVFQALIISTLQSFYSEKNKVVIPLFGEMSLSHYEIKVQDRSETKLDITIEPCDFLMEELNAILNGDLTASKKFIQKNILMELQNKLEIDELDIDID